MRMKRKARVELIAWRWTVRSWKAICWIAFGLGVSVQVRFLAMHCVKRRLGREPNRWSGRRAGWSFSDSFNGSVPGDKVLHPENVHHERRSPPRLVGEALMEEVLRVQVSQLKIQTTAGFVNPDQSIKGRCYSLYTSPRFVPFFLRFFLLLFSLALLDCFSFDLLNLRKSYVFRSDSDPSNLCRAFRANELTSRYEQTEEQNEINRSGS